jgi:hypothetical protein
MLDPLPKREDGLRAFGSYAGEAPQIGKRGLVQVDGIVWGRSPARRPVSRVGRSGIHRLRWSGRYGGGVCHRRRERSGRGIAMSALRRRLYRSVADGRLDRRVVRPVRTTSERRPANRGEHHESEHGSRGANDGGSPSPRRGLLSDLDEPEGQLPTSRSHRLHGSALALSEPSGGVGRFTPRAPGAGRRVASPPQPGSHPRSSGPARCGR